MSREDSFLTADVRDMFKHTIVSRHPLEEHFRDFEQQTETARLGMWLFLATEVMFFGALFLSLGVYRYQYAEAFEAASQRLNWQIGGVNTLVLLVSSLTMVVAVYYARLGNRRAVVWSLLMTAAMGALFLALKAIEYYIDYRENLIPGWRFEPSEWAGHDGLSADQVPHVQLFLIMYFTMTGIHALHLTIGIGIVLILAVLAARGRFTSQYYSPIDVTGLYWHFVDIVWIFLLPMLYLVGTHTLK
jgi:cytochrome c oxidase subunit III